MTGIEREVPDGESALVVTGRGADAGLERLSVRDPDDRNVLAVTYRNAPDAFIDDWASRHGRPPASIGVIGVGETMRSPAAGSATARESPRRSLVRAVPDPTDLPALRRAVAECLADWPRERSTVVYFDSLTALLEHAGLPAVERFVERLTDRIDAAGATGYFAVDPTEHDETTIDSLASLFERVLERPDDSGPDIDVSNARLNLGAARDVDALFDVLCVGRRRFVLHYLTREAERVGLEELTERVAAWEHDADGEVPEELYRRVYTSLYQIHVPKLADHGLVEYDRHRDVLALDDDLDAARPFLSLAAEYDLETDEG